MKKKLLFLSIALTTSIFAFSQKQVKIYYDKDWKGCSKSKAEFYRIVTYDKSRKPIGKVVDYFITGELQTEIEGALYIDKVDDSKSKLIGLSTGFYKSGEKQFEHICDNQGNIVTSKNWYQNGQLRRSKEYKDGHLNGKLLSYWNNGNAKRIDEYKNGELISGKCFNIDGEEIPYFDYEIFPTFKGGEVGFTQFMLKNLTYPQRARNQLIEGKVLVGFAVNVDGAISDVKIIQGIYWELDNEAIRIVKAMPNWTPGMQDGEVVKVYFVLPIQFSIR